MDNLKIGYHSTNLLTGAPSEAMSDSLETSLTMRSTMIVLAYPHASKVVTTEDSHEDTEQPTEGTTVHPTDIHTEEDVTGTDIDMYADVIINKP